MKRRRIYGEKRQLEKMLETLATGVFAKMVEEMGAAPGVLRS